MKKIIIFIVFVICVLASFYITRNVLDKHDKVQTERQKPQSEEQQKSLSEQHQEPQTEQQQEPQTEQQQEPQSEQQQEPQSEQQQELVQNPKPKSQPDGEIKHVKISFPEIKKLIKNGTYERDRRLSKQYKVEYVDVSDDDAIAGLQQNLTYVQERVEYGEDGDGGWRDFEVVGVDYDKKSGLVNLIKIKPIY